MVAEFLTRAEVARLLRINPATVTRASQEGRLPPPVLVSSRRPRWEKAELLARLGQSARPVAQEAGK